MSDLIKPKSANIDVVMFLDKFYQEISILNFTAAMNTLAKWVATDSYDLIDCALAEVYLPKMPPEQYILLLRLTSRLRNRIKWVEFYIRVCEELMQTNSVSVVNAMMVGINFQPKDFVFDVTLSPGTKHTGEAVPNIIIRTGSNQKVWRHFMTNTDMVTEQLKSGMMIQCLEETPLQLRKVVSVEQVGI